MRRSPQAAGTGYMVSRYSKHPELAYYFLQWFTGPPKATRRLPIRKDIGTPCGARTSRTRGLLQFGKQFLETTLENTKYATSLLMLPGNEEYFNVLDKNLALVMQGTFRRGPPSKSRQDGTR